MMPFILLFATLFTDLEAANAPDNMPENNNTVDKRQWMYQSCENQYQFGMNVSIVSSK